MKFICGMLDMSTQAKFTHKKLDPNCNEEFDTLEELLKHVCREHYHYKYSSSNRVALRKLLS